MSAERRPFDYLRLPLALTLALLTKSSNVLPEKHPVDSEEKTAISLTIKELQETQRDLLSPPVVIFRTPTPTPFPSPTRTPTPTHTPTPEPSPTPTRELEISEISLSPWEKEMYQAIQELRKERNLPALELSSSLTEIARQRSLDMATRNYFSHTTPEELMVFDLLDQTGNYYPYAGENLARTNINEPEEAVQEIMEDFLESGTHRRNLLRPEFSLIGIGYAFSEENNIKYITIIFVSPPQ